MNKHSKIVIIGGGIIGCSIAYELTKNGYNQVTVIEKNSTIPGLNQSARNGGIIHAGLYYPADVEPLKAKLCVKGNKLMYEFCKQYGVPYKKTGKLIVATNPKEEKYLDFFLHIAKENKVPEIKKISEKKVQQLEPNLSNVIAALFVPSTGSVALSPLIKTIKSLAEKSGATFFLNTTVVQIRFRNNKPIIKTKTLKKVRVLETDYVINAAGLYSDTIAKLINPSTSYEIAAARGELFQFNKSKRDDIYMDGIHVYETPFFYDNETSQKVDIPVDKIKKLLKSGKVTKTLGAHLSPAFDKTKNGYVIQNTVAVGPLKTLSLGKENYLSKNKTAYDYTERVSKFFPNLKASDLKPRFTGIMAVLKGHTDFIIEKDKKHPNCINLVGMDSPAFTACFAIARHVKNLIQK
jgi:L-2-hydroxyglutarate oxidase LhgO